MHPKRVAEMKRHVSHTTARGLRIRVSKIGESGELVGTSSKVVRLVIRVNPLKYLVASWVLCSAGLAFATEAFLIGQSAPLTGPAAAAGRAFVEGARLHIDQVNRNGGVKGRLIDLRTLDDGYDPQRASANAKALIDAGAVGLFGFVNTPASVAGARVASQYRTAFIAPATGVSTLRGPGSEHVFNVRASFKDEASRIVSHLRVLNVQRISFFSLQIPESEVMQMHMSKLLAESGLKFYAVANMAPGRVDIAKAAEQLKTRDTQAVVMFCPGEMCAELVREVRKRDASPNFYAVSSAGDVFGKVADEGASISVTQVVPYPWLAGSFPIVKSYQDAMKAAGNSHLSYWSLEGYISAHVLVAGLRKLQPPFFRAAFHDAMRSLGRLNLGGYELSFDQDPNSGSQFTDITLARRAGVYIR